MYVIGCLEANEAGDYLAGFFAPLAFLWLAAAVFIQSSELREQRRELALTRNEFALNRQVATEQAEAAKAQADAARKAAEMAAEQTSILRDEYESRLQYRALEMFQIKLKAAENALRAARFPLKGQSANVPATFDLDNLKPWLNEAKNEIDKNGVLVAPTRWPEPAPIEKAMRAIRALLDEAIRHFKSVSEVEQARHNADLQKLQERVERAEAGIGELARLGWSADREAGSAEA
ncbi:hypothetical protein [Stappia sp. MMSF_3263]|uniref:hypothetical protein n=1 Tax=Stappia sp. MMSF_3263 TaxID=3046693 RepID=UPI00273E09BE|nr:hypothetical protein [Stappia sp. MMSF_3263]